MIERYDVAVVGAGPVGLLTAIELGLGGVRVLVLERLAAASMAIKAFSIGALGIEALHRRGMTPSIAAAEERAFAAMKIFAAQNGPNLRGDGSKISGHFAGLSLIRKDAQKEPERRGRPVDQPAAEAMLAERARALGIEIRRACDVTGFAQDADGVGVEWAYPSGEGHIRCDYLVGCDGGRSAIRKLAGFGFPGPPPTMTMYTANVEIDHPERLVLIDRDDLGLQPSESTKRGWHRTPRGVFAYGPFPGLLYMLDFSGPPVDRQAPVTREEIEAVLRRVSGADVRVKSFENASRWTDNTRLVDTYRKGRVLLAGDAAHIHSPFGGQGMSLGLVDAANLGWKLAAVIRGEMPDCLLDTYSAERRPVAEAVLANTLAQAAIMRPDPQSGAMRNIVAKLMQFDDVNRFIGEMMSGLSTRYDLGSEQDAVGRLIGDKPVNSGGSEVSLYDLMQDGRGVFLDATRGEQASQLVASRTQSICCVAIDSGPSMLIRPDACVAWASEENNTDGLEEALRRWFSPAGDDRLMMRSD